MKAIAVHFYGHGFASFKEKEYMSTGVVNIPGLGDLEIKDCLSIETMESVFREIEEVARLKLGIIKSEEKSGSGV